MSASLYSPWQRLLSEKQKFFISWRLAVGSSLVFWGIMWGLISTLEIGYELDLRFDFWNLITFLVVSLIGLTFTTSLEILVFKQIFRTWTFGWAILLKSIISSMVVFAITILSALVFKYVFGRLPLIGGEMQSAVWDLFSLPLFWGAVVYWSAIIDLNFFMLSAHTLTGTILFTQYTRGRFYKPTEEDRIFLFVDMDRSTSIAEKLGNEHYFGLLNEIYFDFSFPIELHNAEIYQYVGDEVVMSWDMESGIDKNRCVRLYFELEWILERNAIKYKQKYGAAPTFKGALHSGCVTTGEVGYIRTAILHSGDVINTASRLERLSGKLKRKLLITEELFKQLDTSTLEYEALGEFELSGKKNRLPVYAINKILD